MLIHGLSGTPLEMANLARPLSEQGFSVYIPHYSEFGFDPEMSFLSTSSTWDEWQKKLYEDIKRLEKTYEKIMVCGICVGALAAIDASLCSSKVVALSLLSTVLYYDGWATPWYQFLIPILYRIPSFRNYDFLEREPYGIKNEKMRNFKKNELAKQDKITIAGAASMTMHQLYQSKKYIRWIKRNLKKITIPVQIIHSVEDDASSVRSVAYLEKHLASKNIEKIILNDSYHLITLDNEKDLVSQSVVNFFNKFK